MKKESHPNEKLAWNGRAAVNAYVFPNICEKQRIFRALFLVERCVFLQTMLRLPVVQAGSPHLNNEHCQTYNVWGCQNTRT